MDYLIGLIALLGGGLFFYRSKAKTAESLNKNVEVKNELLKEDQKISKSKGDLEAEEAKREDVKSATELEVQKDVNLKDVADFFNKLKPGS